MNVSPRRWCWLAVWLFLLGIGLGHSSALGASAPGAGPRVSAVSGPVQLGAAFEVTVEGLKAWASASNQPHRLRLFIDGRTLPGVLPESVDLTRGVLHYHLRMSAESRERWYDLLRRPEARRRVAISVGPDPDSPFPTDLEEDRAAVLEVIPSPWGLVALGAIVLLLGGLLLAARNTDLLRSEGPAPAAPARRAFSLARVQMAFWFFLILTGFLVIWLVTGDLHSVNQSLLGLMGISAGTGLGSVLIDRTRRDGARRAAAKGARSSQGLLRDLLEDGRGVSLHRFQMASWTLLLGIIFVAEAYMNLKMPEFGTGLLGLMGISSGTYLGFKHSEGQEAAAGGEGTGER